MSKKPSGLYRMKAERAEAEAAEAMRLSESLRQECCGFVFDLGREESVRADREARIRLDWWLEQGKNLAEVSDYALRAEFAKRFGFTPANSWLTEEHRIAASGQLFRQYVSAGHLCLDPPNIHDGDSVTIQGVTFRAERTATGQGATNGHTPDRRGAHK